MKSIDEIAILLSKYVDCDDCKMERCEFDNGYDRCKEKWLSWLQSKVGGFIPMTELLPPLYETVIFLGKRDGKFIGEYTGEPVIDDSVTVYAKSGVHERKAKMWMPFPEYIEVK